MKKIMFSDEFMLTQAVLDGRKAQTRRIITPQPTYQDNCGICWKGYAYGLNPIDFNEPFGSYMNFVSGTEYDKSCRRYRKGEVVAVAQSYRDCGGVNEEGVPMWEIISQKVGGTNAGWDNKMFVRADLMPHRIRITNVRVERLQDISDEDCLREGVVKDTCKTYFNGYTVKFSLDQYNNMLSSEWFKTPREAFAHLINKVSGKGTWERNPYVYVYDFELVKNSMK